MWIQTSLLLEIGLEIEPPSVIGQSDIVVVGSSFFWRSEIQFGRSHIASFNNGIIKLYFICILTFNINFI